MDKIRIMVVSHNTYEGSFIVKRLADLLGEKYFVFDCHLKQLAETYASKCYIILGNGICKDSNSDERSMKFSSKELAIKNDRHYLPSCLISWWWPLAWITSITIRFVSAIDQYLLESERW